MQVVTTLLKSKYNPIKVKAEALYVWVLNCGKRFNLFVTIWAWLGQWGLFSCHCHRLTLLWATGLQWALVELLRAIAGPVETRLEPGHVAAVLGEFSCQALRKSLRMCEMKFAGAQVLVLNADLQIYRDVTGVVQAAEQLGVAVGYVCIRPPPPSWDVNPHTQDSCQNSVSCPVWRMSRLEWLGYISNISHYVSLIISHSGCSSGFSHLPSSLRCLYPSSIQNLTSWWGDDLGCLRKEWLWMGSAGRGVSQLGKGAGGTRGSLP